MLLLFWIEACEAIDGSPLRLGGPTGARLTARQNRLGRGGRDRDRWRRHVLVEGAGLRRGHATAGFADYLAGERSLRDILLPTALPWLRVILAGTVSESDDHGDYLDAFTDPSTLARLIAEATERCDVVVIDTPPGLGPVTRAALRAAEIGRAHV